MALSVQTNTAAITALKNLNTNSQAMNNSLNRLSSGFRINSAADDASGFAVSSKLDAQTGRLKAASQNATQATAMVKMADAGVNEIQNMVNRIQTLATQAASANNSGELGKLDAERIKLESAINKIAGATNYNGVSLLSGNGNTTIAGAGTAGAFTTVDLNSVSAGDAGAGAGSLAISANATTTTNFDITFTDKAGTVFTSAANAGTGLTDPTAATAITLTSADGGKSMSVSIGGAGTMATGSESVTITRSNSTFQVGADNNANNQVAVNLSNSYTTGALGLGGAGDISTQSNAQAYIDTAKTAMNLVITQRADLGATQNQLGFVQANLATSIEQTTASVSSIKDADMAMEMANFTKNKILTQAGTSMLAQANQASQNVMTLFR